MKYKVGDKVMIVNDLRPSKYVGKIGTIKTIADHTRIYTYTVKLDNGTTNLFKKDWIVKIVNEKMARLIYGV